jgi:hypothetical protein
MAASQHSRVQSTVSRVDWTRWTESKAWNGQLASVLRDGIIFIDYLEKGNTINSEYHIALLERLNDEIKKKRPHLKKKKALFHQDNAAVQNDRKIAWIRLRIAYPSTVFSRSGLQWLFSVCRPQKNACWKET